MNFPIWIPSRQRNARYLWMKLSWSMSNCIICWNIKERNGRTRQAPSNEGYTKRTSCWLTREVCTFWHDYHSNMTSDLSQPSLIHKITSILNREDMILIWTSIQRQHVLGQTCPKTKHSIDDSIASLVMSMLLFWRHYLETSRVGFISFTISTQTKWAVDFILFTTT